MKNIILSIRPKFVEKILTGEKTFEYRKKLPEEKIDAGSAITGCGPAFVCLLIEAMTDAGIRLGLPRDKAMLFAEQTFLGTAKLALDTKTEPSILRGAVCSPAGSTIEGIAALERLGARNAIFEAVSAAYKKTLELGA